MKRLAYVFMILALAWAGAEAEAGVYQWRDENGRLHFTDNPERIPRKYWDQLGRKKTGGLPRRATAPRVTRVPLERTNRAVEIPVIVNGRRRISFFLDTGATYCQIRHEDARALNLDPTGGSSVKVLMADGRYLESRMVILDSMRIGSFEIGEVKAIVGDLRLLGLNVLQRFRVTLDIPAGEIILEAANP